MKVWMPNPWYYPEPHETAIPSIKNLAVDMDIDASFGVNNIKAWISPTREDPAVLIPSGRDDGYEEIKWHGEVHLVYSADLEHEK